MNKATDDDFELAVMIELDNPEASFMSVAAAIRKVQWLGALETRDHTYYFLQKVGTPKALDLIKAYNTRKKEVYHV